MNYELIYNGVTRRWEGKDAQDHVRLWMDDTTFQRHVWAYLDSQRIYQPLLGDLDKAREHCRKFSYWQGCTDSAVHWIVLGIEKRNEIDPSE